MLDLSKQPVVDSHCHAFLPEKETKPFEQYLTLSEDPVPKIDMVSTLLYRHVVCELSRVLEIDGRHEEILEERHKRYKRDPVGYIRLLFEDANIETLLVDTGYPEKLFSGYSIDLKDFSEIAVQGQRSSGSTQSSTISLKISSTLMMRSNTFTDG